MSKEGERHMEGKITQVIGPVVDVYFEDELPSIYEHLVVQVEENKTVTLEVSLHMGDHVVRTIALRANRRIKARHRCKSSNR
jgi:F-type H+/Na+-transporting ATPase subunit beta